MTRTRTVTSLASLAVLAALSLSACNAPSQNASSSASPSQAASEHAHDHAHEGHDHPMPPAKGKETVENKPRLVVSVTNGAVVLDEKMQELGRYSTAATPKGTIGADGRHVFEVQGPKNVVNIVDAGSWRQGHDDHFHYFTVDPSLLDAKLEGGKPVHVTANAKAKLTTVYFDTEGKAVVVSNDALVENKLADLPVVKAKTAHHGVVVPMLDGSFLVTQSTTGEAMPDVVEWQDAAGKVKDSYTCPGLHGEIADGDTALFGCTDGILKVENGKGSKIKYPSGVEGRIKNFGTDATNSFYAGMWDFDSLAFVNGEDIKVVDVGARYSNYAVTPAGEVAVVGEDGKVRIYDHKGESLGTFDVIGKWVRPDGPVGEVPNVAAGSVSAASTIWVTEPAANKLHAIDLFAKKVTSVDLEGKPSYISVANPSD